MERRRGREEMVMRKGPWMAEEDEILMDYVQKHGPRDWSSIRSKGFMVDKLTSYVPVVTVLFFIIGYDDGQVDNKMMFVACFLGGKSGCKFSAEEERLVIDLQARFGNKWARIATYLQGRTDNDVKNFWSTRQKKMTRILQTSNQPKSQKNNGKAPASRHVATLEEMAPRPLSIAMEQSSSQSQSCQLSYLEDPDVIKMVPLPDLMKPGLLSLETNLPQLEFTPTEKKPCIESQPQFSFQLPHPTLDLPLLPENQDLVPGLGDSNLMDMFGHQETPGPDRGSHYSVNAPFIGLRGSSRNGGKGDCDNPATPDSFFDDFPTDMFDYIESLPSSSEW
ncbi:Transcription factor duo1 [Thalictrum thalictroides]|uniref:Transcription factor duo1 n=1 Tax=Thalictrum thalictroides TaxID=46969 RepID=A0A7J6X9N0_THATH|nr:Transcription factor duo1 [Thalictrum thalictroides]